MLSDNKSLGFWIGDRFVQIPISTQADDLALAADILANTDLLNSKVTTIDALDVLIQSKNTTQDSLLTTAAVLNATQESKITTIQTLDTTQESRLVAIEAVDSAQATSIVAVESKNTTQDSTTTSKAATLDTVISKGTTAGWW